MTQLLNNLCKVAASAALLTLSVAAHAEIGGGAHKMHNAFGEVYQKGPSVERVEGPITDTRFYFDTEHRAAEAGAASAQQAQAAGIKQRMGGQF